MAGVAAGEEGVAAEGRADGVGGVGVEEGDALGGAS